MNPFELKPIKLTDRIMNWKEMYPKQYNICDVDPYTKTRIILMNGTEVEAVFFGHQFSRNCNNNDLRRDLAMVRNMEQQQQKKLINIKPINESILEQTISYEQLAVDLTAHMAQNEPDINVKNSLDFALLEDFDHLYRYSNLLEMEYKILPEKLVGRYTEIMPGRPTIAHHRCPLDNIKCYTNFNNAELITKLHANIITAAEQQTMNYYMNVGSFYTSDLGRKLYQEIAMVEEEHVTQYGSLLDPNQTWLENNLMHQYTECYLYYSCMEDETHPFIKKIWCDFFEIEVAHLHKAVELLMKYENKDWCQVIPDGTFPKLLKLCSNIDYVRKVLLNTVNITSDRENYASIKELCPDADFFKYQSIVNNDVCQVPSHIIIDKYIKKNCMDYRFEVAPNPIVPLQNRCADNTNVGRIPC